MYKPTRAIAITVVSMGFLIPTWIALATNVVMFVANRGDWMQSGFRLGICSVILLTQAALLLRSLRS